MNIALYLQREEGPSLVCTTTLGQFFADNIDSLSRSEFDDIEEALTNGEPYHGGGGASLEWSIHPAP